MDISVLIPVRDKEKERLELVIKSLGDNVSEVVIVDYGSKEPLKIELPRVKVVRYEGGIWNKAHAINIGFRNSSSEYIMTLDADILLYPGFFDDLKRLVDKDKLIYGDKVLRLRMEDYSTDWATCLDKARPWRKNETIRDEFSNTATGGFQLFHRDWFNSIKMLDENLIYYGGMDNVTLIEARRSNMIMTKLTKPIIHLEHPNNKEKNLTPEEREFAEFVRRDRWDLIDYILNSPEYFKEFGGSLDGPKDTLTKRYQDLFNEMKETNPHKAIDISEVPRETKVMICIINNKQFLPERFVKSMMGMYEYTKSIFPGTDLRFVRACQVNNMRNLAVSCAIEEKFDYLVQLDDDHHYPQHTIIKLLSHQKEFVTGCTRQRVHPYYPTQFKKFKLPIRTEDNMIFSQGEDKLEKIECSGPVGMLIKVSALKDVKYPWYDIDYTATIDGKPAPVGGDYVFCRKVLEAGKELWLDHSLDFPHFITGEVSGVSTGKSAKISLDDGKR